MQCTLKPSSSAGCPDGVRHGLIAALPCPSNRSQRRNEAWRRYKKLKQRGDLADGANPCLSSALTLPSGRLSLDPEHADEGHDGHAACSGGGADGGKASPADSAQAAAEAGVAGGAATSGCGTFRVFGGLFSRGNKVRAAQMLAWRVL